MFTPLRVPLYTPEGSTSYPNWDKFAEAEWKKMDTLATQCRFIQLPPSAFIKFTREVLSGSLKFSAGFLCMGGVFYEGAHRYYPDALSTLKNVSFLQPLVSDIIDNAATPASHLITKAVAVVAEQTLCLAALGGIAFLVAKIIEPNPLNLDSAKEMYLKNLFVLFADSVNSRKGSKALHYLNAIQLAHASDKTGLFKSVVKGKDFDQMSDKTWPKLIGAAEALSNYQGYVNNDDSRTIYLKNMRVCSLKAGIVIHSDLYIQQNEEGSESELQASNRNSRALNNPVLPITDSKKKNESVKAD